MEKEVLITAMKTSISEVLETMFFLPLEFPDEVNPEQLWGPQKEEPVVGKLTFSGLFTGDLFFFIPRNLAVSLTGSFLGEDEASVSEDHVTETVKEITNMIAGSTFGNYDDQAIFDLGIPEMANFDEAKGQGSDSGDEIFIPVDTLDDKLALKVVVKANDR